MQYMLMICGVEGDESNALEDNPGYTIEEWVQETTRRGVRLQGDRLRPPADATMVRVRRGEVLISDGPFAETKEQMYGYDLLDCADLDEAIEIASKHPMARAGMIEVRPVWPIDEE
ncbi:MAG: YciI family protein [Pseudonocardia sp.]